MSGTNPSGNGENLSGRTGENPAAAGAMEGRGKEIFEKYQYDDDDYAKFLTVLSETLPGKTPLDVLNDSLDEDELKRLNDALDAAFKEPEPAEAQPAGADSAAAAAAATAAARTAYAREHGVVPRNAETLTEQEARERKERNKNLAQSSVKVAAGVAAGVAATLLVVGGMGGSGSEAPAQVPETNTGEAVVQNEQETSAESNEGLGEYEDSLAGTYADAEDPTQINHNKLARDGRTEAPYNFGESSIVTGEDGEVDLEATYANAMEREEWLAHHSTIEFAAQYALLSDGVKVPDAVGLDGQELAKRMMEDEQFKEQVVESFMDLLIITLCLAAEELLTELLIGEDSLPEFFAKRKVLLIYNGIVLCIGIE